MLRQGRDEFFPAFTSFRAPLRRPASHHQQRALIQQLRQERLFIIRTCENLIAEMKSYAWHQSTRPLTSLQRRGMIWQMPCDLPLRLKQRTPPRAETSQWSERSGRGGATLTNLNAKADPFRIHERVVAFQDAIFLETRTQCNCVTRLCEQTVGVGDNMDFVISFGGKRSLTYTHLSRIAPDEYNFGQFAGTFAQAE